MKPLGTAMAALLFFVLGLPFAAYAQEQHEDGRHRLLIKRKPGLRQGRRRKRRHHGRKRLSQKPRRTSRKLDPLRFTRRNGPKLGQFLGANRFRLRDQPKLRARNRLLTRNRRPSSEAPRRRPGSHIEPRTGRRRIAPGNSAAVIMAIAFPRRVTALTLDRRTFSPFIASL